MSDARPGGGDSASDLFDAWMAHRGAPSAPEEAEEQTPPAPAEEPVPVALATLDPPASPAPAAPAAPEAPAAPAAEPLGARLRALRGEAAHVEATPAPDWLEEPTVLGAEPVIAAPAAVAAPPVTAPEPPAAPPPTPETTWRGYVLPSITPADLVAAEREPLHEPEPLRPERELEYDPLAVVSAPYDSLHEPEDQPEPEPKPAVIDEPVAHAQPELGITAALAAAAAKAEEQSRQPRSPSAAPLAAPTPPPVIRTREPAFAATTKPAPPPKPDDMPAVTVFSPREGNRTVAGLLLVAALVAAAMAGYLAWYERSTATIGIGCTLFILVLVIWATRASSEPAHLKINSGHLTVERTGSIRHFDLASKYTALEVHGRPGLPGWKVLIEQRDAVPYVIDASMVNPRDFMRVLRYYRPGL